MSSVSELSTPRGAVSRVRASKTNTSRHPERRKPRKGGRRFEDQAASILQNHGRRLDTHRRSVMLFYLLFGLLAGFFLGLAGAKGVLANPVAASSTVSELPDARAQYAAARQQRHASLLQLTAARAVLQPAPRSTSISPNSATLPYKTIFMGLLAAIFVVTVSLTVTFLRHLNRAYTPARKVSLEWGPSASRLSAPPVPLPVIHYQGRVVRGPFNQD